MKGNKIIWIFLLIALIIAICGYIYINNIKDKQVSGKIVEYTPQEEIKDEQMRKTMVNLYFYNNEKGELEKEARIIDVAELIENPYSKLVELLIEGPKNENLNNLMPTDLKVNNAEIMNGCVTLNLSIEFLNYTEDQDLKHKMIYSIVNTLTELTEVDSVRFLINGKPNEEFNEEYTRI